MKVKISLTYTQTNKECEEFQLLSSVSTGLLVSAIHAWRWLLCKKTTLKNSFLKKRDREGKRGVMPKQQRNKYSVESANVSPMRQRLLLLTGES